LSCVESSCINKIEIQKQLINYLKEQLEIQEEVMSELEKYNFK